MNSVLIKNLSLTIGNERILKNLNTEFSGQGKIVLFGPNGAGKSTLLKAITGLVEPQSGEVFINGFSIRNKRENALSQIGAHIEPGSYYGQFTGKEVLKFVEKMRGRFRDDCKLNADELIYRFEMGGYANKKVHTYSTGMRKTLSVAAAVVCAPPIVLLDEPTDGLDPLSSGRVNEMISYLQKDCGCMVIITSHDIEEAETGSTRKLILMDGRVVFDSPTSEERVSLNLVVSDAEHLASRIASSQNYEITGKSVIIRNLDRKEIGGIFKDIVQVSNVESVSVDSDFRQFYEKFARETKTNGKNKI